jgi:hypothetical protein
MVAFYLATSLVILLFSLQRLHLCLGEHDAFFGGFLLQGAQPLFHGG